MVCLVHWLSRQLSLLAHFAGLPLTLSKDPRTMTTICYESTPTPFSHLPRLFCRRKMYNKIQGLHSLSDKILSLFVTFEIPDYLN